MSKRRHTLQSNNVQRFAYVFLGLMCIVFLFPMYVSIMVSLSSRDSIATHGYQLWPSEFSLQAYEILFSEYGKAIGRAVLLTVSTGLAQPVLSILLCMLMAYPLSQPDFKGRDFWRVFLVITMLFSGGIVPTYILKTKYLGLKDNIMVYLIPGVGAWTIFLFRTFFVNIDKSMVESAKIDGANKMQILMKIMLPLTKPLVAMNFFSGFLGRWNDIQTPMYYIRDRKLFTVQYMLQEMLRSVEQVKSLMEAGMSMDISMSTKDMPIDAVRFSLAVIGAMPALILFPYLQKYYAKGITIGSTKG